jgi:hypothetical protein
LIQDEDDFSFLPLDLMRLLGYIWNLFSRKDDFSNRTLTQREVKVAIATRYYINTTWVKWIAKRHVTRRGIWNTFYQISIMLAQRVISPSSFGQFDTKTSYGMQPFMCCITNIRKSPSSAHDILVCLRRCNLEGLRSQPRGTHLFWCNAWVIGSLQFYGCHASSFLCEFVLSAYAC